LYHPAGASAWPYTKASQKPHHHNTAGNLPIFADLWSGLASITRKGRRLTRGTENWPTT